MREKITIGLIATLGAGMMGFVIVVAIMIGSPLIGLIAAIGAGGAAMILVRPFWGLLAIVTFAQLDTFANILSEDLPISIVKLLTVVTLGGVIANSYREPRADRIGPREPALRYAVIFGLALFLTGLYADDPKWVAWSIEKLGGMLVLFYLMVRLVRERWQVDIIVLIIVGSTLFSSAIVVYDYTL
ncbi:MAG: hypothetical protein GWN87_27580, partial [Desulfuromonadales bacterium]|nr:hypothetical protein [Desulfuromonadales bacterium]